ncbi:MAG: FtsX-like permease family protein [Ekhidna sp.]|nr:FtsX-like permease family protein [Ekhidna sp.]
MSLFSFDWLAGDRNTALNTLDGVVISRSIAEKYFGSSWKELAIGSTLEIDGNYESIITGVIENTKANSTLQFDWLIPAQAFFAENDWVNDWGNGSFRIYFSTVSEEGLGAVKKRLYNEIITHSSGQENAGEEYLIVHKFEDCYLYSNFENGVVDGGRIDYVRIMIIVAIFILVIASINFMNLTTARSGRRSKEIGLRKVMGAQKSSIGLQFFLESLLLSIASMVVSVFFVWLLIPYFSDLEMKELAIDFRNQLTWIYFAGVSLVVGILSGIYPAVLLPTFNIVKSLRGSLVQSSATALFRKGLVVFQFTISTLLIIGTAVIYSQLDFVLNKDLGLDKDNLVAISTDQSFGDRLETYKNELSQIPQVQDLSISSGNPLQYGRSTSSVKWEGMNNDSYEINIMVTDEHFVSTMGMDVLQGRDFMDQKLDSTNYLINEVMADLMGFEDPINQSLSFWGIDGKVIGVVKNFHMQNMHEAIAPLLITCIAPSRERNLLVRINGEPNAAMKSIKEVYNRLNPKGEFEYAYLDEVYRNSYQGELTVSTLVKIFAIISLFVSCLGLFGLSAFTAEQRSKEIGVRKVHGASPQQLVLLLSRDYSILMGWSFLLALPFGYYYANQWLEGFEFRTVLNPLIFLFAGLFTFLIGALTVSFKSLQAAGANPVKTLKDE